MTLILQAFFVVLNFHSFLLFLTLTSPHTPPLSLSLYLFPSQPTPRQAYYHRAVALLRMHNDKGMLDLSHALRIQPTFFEVRSGCRTLSDGLVNVTLANKGSWLNWPFFHCSKAYLTRAAYYGREGRLTKAIMNCTEAIRLEPNSARAYMYR